MRSSFFILLLSSLLHVYSFAQQPYTILISFDGFRYDYMDRGITPNLWKVAENGVKASSLRPVYPSKTFPNHFSIITGMYPENHGIINNTMYDPHTREIYKINDPAQVRNPRWYKGEAFWETAQRHGITAASFFWPGSEVELEYRRPKYFKNYDHDFPYFERVDGVVNWLLLPYDQRPRFMTVYFDATDTYAHKYGPNSDSTDFAIKQLDEIAGYLIGELTRIKMLDSTNLIFVSDHGMTQIDKSKYIDVDALLPGEKYDLWGWGTYALIQPSKGDVERIYQKLKSSEKNYRVYKRSEIPDFYHFSSNPLIPEIVVVTALGWEIGTASGRSGFEKWGSLGNHGYGKDELDMHGYFVAMGPSFKKNFRTGTLWNIDIYPLLCEIFDIPVRGGIDGQAGRIRFVLKKY